MYGVSTFLGFASGTVVGAPAASGRLVEVVGDSISAGYGNLGAEPHPNWVATPACHWTAENSSYYATYAAVAGRALGAEVSTVARSGWGMSRDLDGNASGVLSSVYANAVGTDDPVAWGFTPEASAVVINLGTNDQAQGDPGAGYEAAYGDFLDEVRSHYPDAWIFLAIGSMLSDSGRDAILGHLDNVLAARVAGGDSRASILDLGVQDLGADGSVPTGCDWHPSLTDHERMAAILEGELQARLGW
jgi:lysophospholipase L1-like esterase